MPKGFKGWAIWAFAEAVLLFAYKLVVKLVDNALIGWGDEKIAVWFGITSPDASTVFYWVVPFALAALTLWIFHRLTVHPLKRKLAEHGGDQFYATGVVGSELLQQTWIRKVEPSHVIILGLVIALGGVIWQMRINWLATEPSGGQPAIAAASPPTTKVPSVATASIDVPKKIEAIDELLEILDRDWDPWMNLCQGLSTGGWRNQILGKQIKELRDSIYKMSSDYNAISRKIEALNKRNEKFPDIYALTTQPYMNQFKPALDSFVKVFGSLSDPMGNALDQVTLENVFEKYATDLYAQSQGANNWRSLTARSALEIRKSFSQ
ncbi:hypothetical protein [Bradyrhizobium oligotrophicum]|uniref:hypothetical protein n=1 Tax=Bradyrhizobium oligotrophicum TaxID=44255 RepID=UPI003EBBC926